MQDPILVKISKARTQLLLNQPWFGSLGMRLGVVEFDEPTMATDGTHLYYNRKFVEALSEKELQAVFAHEIMHCALRHMYRIGTRDMRGWNEACDLAINPILKDVGFQLPEGALLDDNYRDMSAEQIYAQRKRDGGGGGSGPPDPNCPTGRFTKPPAGQGKSDKVNPGKDNGPPGPDDDGPDDIKPMSETDWEIAAQQATAACTKAGKMPANVDRTVQKDRQANTDWIERLWQFAEQTLPSDFSWSTPNRRFISQDLYMPGQIKENMPGLYVGVDTSGSITQDMLDLIRPQIEAIVHGLKPEFLEVTYCDTRIANRQTFVPDDPEITLAARGGGGTNYQPYFDDVAQMVEEGKGPAAIMVIGDMEHFDSITDPGIPVLWIAPEWVRVEAMPFGDLIKVSEYK